MAAARAGGVMLVTGGRGAGGRGAIVAIGCGLWAIAAPACAGDDPACGPRDVIVERVIDGDTIVVTGGRKIRYLLVDAPETTDGHHACYGDNAAQFNADLVLGKRVQLTYDVVCDDRFGRTLAYVTVGGDDVSTLLLARGYACLLHIPPDGDGRAAELAAVEAAARAAGLGLWSACDPVPCR
ncbi:MAG TPA: thermonuclease family protein [Kofleriaceae bacterium]|jgi:micrococcal nuclease|nr:thermonuclease family protein [Kofleriaceae bacterium]